MIDRFGRLRNPRFLSASPIQPYGEPKAGRHLGIRRAAYHIGLSGKPIKTATDQADSIAEYNEAKRAFYMGQADAGLAIFRSGQENPAAPQTLREGRAGGGIVIDRFGRIRNPGKPKTSIATGVAINKLRKLQKAWDYWNAQRSNNWHRETWAWQQQMAEKECARIGPEIVALQKQIEKADAAKENPAAACNACVNPFTVEPSALMKQLVPKLERAGLVNEHGGRTVEMLGRRTGMSNTEILEVVRLALQSSRPATGQAIADAFKDLYSNEAARAELDRLHYIRMDEIVDPAWRPMPEAELDRMIAALG